MFPLCRRRENIGVLRRIRGGNPIGLEDGIFYLEAISMGTFVWVDIGWSRSVVVYGVCYKSPTRSCLIPTQYKCMHNDTGSGGENPVCKGGDCFQLQRSGDTGNRHSRLHL